MKPFPWRAGMRTKCGMLVIEGGSCGLIGYRPGIGVEDLGREDYEPDPNDGATKGALLEVVRGLWGFPDLYPVRVSEGRMPHTWRVGAAQDHDEPPYREGWGFRGRCVKEGELARRVGIQPTEFAALLAAHQESP